jgi:hypothetical protein
MFDGQCKGECKPHSSSKTVYNFSTGNGSLAGKRVVPPTKTKHLEQ